jgi:hypothetical protein
MQRLRLSFGERFLLVGRVVAEVTNLVCPFFHRRRDAEFRRQGINAFLESAFAIRMDTF